MTNVCRIYSVTGRCRLPKGHDGNHIAGEPPPNNRPLRGVDARILDNLARLVKLGEHLGSKTRPLWTHKDVIRVANEYLRAPHAEPPKLAGRAAGPRSARPHPPIPRDEHKPIELSKRQADVLEGLTAGHDEARIARDLHIARATAANLVVQTVHALGAVDRWHAVELVEHGAVQVHVRRNNVA